MGHQRTTGLNCNGCRACCLVTDRIKLRPGDDASLYETEDGWIKANGTGACRYLGKDGCTIYDHRPAECRAYDCRAHLAGLTGDMNRKARRGFVAGHPWRNVFKAAMDRMQTMTGSRS